MALESPTRDERARPLAVARHVEDLAAFLTGGWGDFIHTWVVAGPDPLDPEEFTDRLLRTTATLFSPFLARKGDRR